MKKTCLVAFLCLLSLLCAALSGCASSEARLGTAETAGATEATEELQEFVGFSSPYQTNEELYRLNFALDYTTCYYGLGYEDFESDFGSNTFHNFTNTCISDLEDPYMAIGWMILSDEEDLAAFRQLVSDELSEKMAEALDYRPTGGNYQPLLLTRKTANIEYTEEFFQSNSLLVIDLCIMDSVTTYFYPENLTVDGETVRLDVRWDRDYAHAGNCGQFCLIVIPTGCTNAELNLIHDPGE